MQITNSKAVALRKKVRSAHRKMKIVGTLYLLGVIALPILAALFAFVKIDVADGKNVALDVFHVWDLLKWQKPLQTLPLTGFVAACIYALLLSTLLINLFRCFAQRGGLYRERVTREHGFNENFVHLKRIGRIFSGSFASVCNLYALIFLVCGKDYAEMQILGAATLGVGLVFHFWCGLMGGKVSLFSYDVSKADYVEHKREIGRIAPFFRNLLQLCIMAAVWFLLLERNSFPVAIATFVAGGLDGVLENKTLLIDCGLQVLMMLLTFALVSHATSDREFDQAGKQAKGAKKFRGYSVLLFLVAIGATVWALIDGGKIWIPAVLSALALAGFLIDFFVDMKATSDEDALTGKKKKVRTGVIFDTVSYEGRI
ncbi:MAG: hypothetical protein IKA88_06915 [Clostridia bacterium]|nr:hypothetical protein [Clostridia bacterium]